MAAGQRLRERRAPRGELRFAGARNPVPELFLWSRAAIWAAALFALLAFEPSRHPEAARWDDPSVTRDLGYAVDVWARWDSVFFLRIAEHGYDAAAAAFYPLYPLSVGLLGRVLLGHYVLAGVVVSLAASLAAFLLLYRVAEERLGADGARRAVLYLALAPMALFLQAVYSEALYLLLAIASFLLAERRRWLPAGLVAGLALLTRIAGVALLPALALLAWRSPERRRALLSLGAAPALFATYPLYLGLETGDPWGFVRAQEIWHRQLSWAGPLGGVWDGLRAGWAGVRQVVSGSTTHAYWSAVDPSDSSPLHVAAVNLQNLAFLCLFAFLTVVAWRRFGVPYGLFCAASLAIPLSVPSERWPLLSMPRLGLVVFPFYLALASLGGRPRVHTAILSVSALVLGVAVVQWSLWQWVA
ncbi:MAG: mannosyltransferase family protein [Gaiellaceae bacterium]